VYRLRQSTGKYWDRVQRAFATFLVDRNGVEAGEPAPHGPESSVVAADADTFTASPPRAPRPALRTYLRVLFLLTTAPLVLLAVALSLNTVINERATAQRAMTDVARALSSAIDGESGRTLLGLQMFARSRAFDAPDLEQLRETALALQASHGAISNLIVFSLDGQRVIDLNAGEGVAVPASDQLAFIIAAKEGRSLASNVFTSPTSGRKAVSLSVPVVRDGDTKYVIAAMMESDLWTDWLKKRIPEGSIAAVDDRDGVIFARSERPEGFVGRTAAEPLRRAYAAHGEGIVKLTNTEGADVYAAFRTSTVTGWHTLVLRPASAVDGRLERYVAWLVAGMTVVLVLAYLASALFARRLENAAAHLRDAIADVGEGRQPVDRSLPVAEFDQAHGAAELAGRLLRRAHADLKRQEQDLRTMIDVIPVGILVARDARADDIAASASFAALTGMPPGENVSQSGPNKDRLPYHYARDGRVLEADELPMQRATRTGREVRDMEFDMVFKDGRVIHLLSQAAPLFDDQGNVRGAIGANVDITQLKQAHRELEAADRQKNDFLATLAHELRNPLAPIRYAIGLLQRDHSPDALEKAVRTIDRQAGHMARLLDDLLDLSRITRNLVELKREPVELHAIVNAAVENARQVADERRHRLEIDVEEGPLWVYGDPARLLQIVDNLLNNACKYTEDGGRITVRVRREGERCTIDVSDTGVGIAPDKAAAVFTMFGQVNPAMQATKGGLGIGLAVVRRLVELHGGAIAVHSEGLGKGSTFTVTLPILERLEPPATPADVPTGATTDELQRLKVLVVDDNVDAVETLAMVLGIAGVKTSAAYSAAQAIAVAEVVQPDVVLLDVGLPDGSGLDVARRMRATQWGKRALLVAITGWGRTEDRARTAQAGFDTHLVKPIDANQVIALLTGYAHRH
jgi:PAS domain S-box-containing protein